MNFEDRLRARMQAAEESAPGRPLDWDRTLQRARRSRRRYIATVALATAVVVAAATASVVALTGGSGPDRGLPPVGPDVTQSPALDETPSPEPEDTPSPPNESPTPDPEESPPPEADCSAAGMSRLPVQQDNLAPEAAETRRRILELAVACDYEGLEALALEGREVLFSFSFGGGESAAQYWRRAEKAGEPVMANLVTVMNIDYKVTEGFDDIDRIFVWPSAAVDPTDEDWQKVIDSGLMTAEEAQGMKEVGYIGWRAQITNDGDWISFIAGD